MSKKKIWVCRDRTGTYISHGRPHWNRAYEVFEEQPKSEGLITAPKTLAKGLRYGERREVVSLIFGHQTRRMLK